MPKERITTAIKEMLDADYGLDIYISMKNDDQQIKRFILDEGQPGKMNGFKIRIRESIAAAIRSKYLAEECQYADGYALANEQNRFYVIKQNDEYEPFVYLNIPDDHLTNFSLDDKNNADAILFKFTLQRNGNIKTLWAYQKIQPASIPNKKKKYFQMVAKSHEHTDIFTELTDQMFIITQKIDLLILGDEIITNEIGLMERHFNFETFVRTSAIRAVMSIITVGLVGNEEKLKDYVQRPNKKYAKKMMQIHKYPVATMSKEHIIEKLNTVVRWKDVFEIRGTEVHLRNFTDVENIIDLFTERYTKSEVTGQEYDTSVKDKAKPIEDMVLT
jgi:hypothetical protein